jgi:hypothetical protein
MFNVKLDLEVLIAGCPEDGIAAPISAASMSGFSASRITSASRASCKVCEGKGTPGVTAYVRSKKGQKPVMFNIGPSPSWLTPAVVAIATAIHEDRAFEDMPILADALQDAGCDNADILAHCRNLPIRRPCPNRSCTGGIILDRGRYISPRPGSARGVVGKRKVVYRKIEPEESHRLCMQCKANGWVEYLPVTQHVCGCWVLDLLLGKE